MSDEDLIERLAAAEGPSVVEGTIVVGDAGEAWVDSALTEDEERQARAWLAKRHVLGPGFSATISWLRADRVVASICPRRSCRHPAERVRTELAPDRRRPGYGHLVAWYGCGSCGRTWRVTRRADKDVLEVLS